MNPRKNLQKRKNRRKKNEKWFNKHLIDSLWHEFRYAPIKMISVEEMKEMYPFTMDIDDPENPISRLLYGSWEDVFVKPIYGTSPVGLLGENYD